MIQIAALAGALAVAGSTDQFNLDCKGALRTLSPATLTDKTEPYTSTYRLDLAAKKWCEGECRAQHDIDKVTPVAIVLELKDTDTPREHEIIHNVISRESGEHHVMIDSGTGSMKIGMFWTGQCEKAPFTGFPAPQTKF
jgi:hypothetical protein